MTSEQDSTRTTHYTELDGGGSVEITIRHPDDEFRVLLTQRLRRVISNVEAEAAHE